MPGLASRNFVVLAATSLLTTAPPGINSAPDTFGSQITAEHFVPGAPCRSPEMGPIPEGRQRFPVRRTMKHNRIDARRDLSIGEIRICAEPSNPRNQVSRPTDHVTYALGAT